MTPAKEKRAIEQSSDGDALGRICGRPEVRTALEWVVENEHRIRKWQMDVTEVPAPPFGEAKRARWLKKKFSELRLRHVHIDEAGNVLGARPGTNDRPAVAIAAHMDTVFAAGTPVEIRESKGKLYGPGISDNGSGLAALLATAGALEAARVQTESPIMFIATAGEEGEGDLRGIRHVFKANSDQIGATLVVDGAGTETIVTRALGSTRFEVTLNGPGGHSWTDFGEPNPIAVLANAIANFYGVEPPRANGRRSAYNIGMIQGGTSVNSIPQSVTMRVDLRSESADEIAALEKKLNQCIASALSASNNGSSRVTSQIRRIGDRPAAELKPGARILEVVQAVDAKLGIKSRVHCSSTDANIPLSLGKEALSIGAGGAGAGAHTLGEWFDPANREVGLKRILLSVLLLARLPE
jgi:acetylornithine deacetylase/succinyl-diaminopimelate desuccinylase-like protein